MKEKGKYFKYLQGIILIAVSLLLIGCENENIAFTHEIIEPNTLNPIQSESADSTSTMTSSDSIDSEMVSEPLQMNLLQIGSSSISHFTDSSAISSEVNVEPLLDETLEERIVPIVEISWFEYKNESFNMYYANALNQVSDYLQSMESIVLNDSDYFIVDENSHTGYIHIEFVKVELESRTEESIENSEIHHKFLFDITSGELIPL